MAAALTSLSYLPQVRKAWRRVSAGDVSWKTRVAVTYVVKVAGALMDRKVRGRIVVDVNRLQGSAVRSKSGT